MPKFAALLDSMAPAEASRLLSDLKEMQRQGKKVTALCVGEPDFDTDPLAKDAAIAAIAEGDTKYAPLAGTHELRSAICAKLKRDNDLDYGLDEVMASTGGKQVIYNAMTATLDPGDEVVIPTPYWAGYPDLIRICRGVPVFVDTRAENDYILQPAELEAAITARTRWIVLNSPSNPTGTVYARKDLEALAGVIRKHPDIWILSDDIYEHLLFDDTAFATMAQVAPDLKDRVLIVNGCSKGYAMTGWRIGFGAGDAELIRRMITVQSQITLAASTISQRAAAEALDKALSIRGPQLRSLEARRDLAISMINQASGLSCNRPKGAFYVYVDCSAMIGRKRHDGGVIATDRDFCRYLLEEAGVGVMPGSAYGRSPYFRLSYGIDEDELVAACCRIQEACARLS